MPYEKQRGSVPNGTNQSGARKAFHEKKFYDVNFFPTHIPHIDLWEQNTALYGRVDPEGNGIFPDEAFLAPVPGSKDLFAMNFVAEAYGELIQYLQSRRKERKIQSSWLLDQLIPKKGWVSMTSAHFQHVQAIVNSFKGWFAGQELCSFQAFAKHFATYLEEMQGQANLSLEAFSKKGKSNIFMSGLMISHQERGNSLDREKAKWIKDPNFLFYCRASSNFGFLVDKHAPWRIVFSLNGKESSLRASKAGLDKGPFSGYNVINNIDDQLVIRYLINIFRSLKKEKQRRSEKVIKELDLLADLNADQILEIYILIRKSEEQKKISSYEGEKIKVISKEVSRKEAIRHLNSMFTS